MRMTMTKLFKRVTSMNRERGSALLVSLMVMVGLSLLGLGFVAISETESTISVNERNSVQTRAVAEAGVRAVIEWFQDPEWADDTAMLPPNDEELKPVRSYEDPTNAGTFLTDRYRTDPTALLFDKPFKPARVDRFYGSRDNPDVLINHTTLTAAGSGAETFLTDLNQTLFAGVAEGGVLTEIRIYAPPISGGTLNAQGYYDGGQRLGLASIETTATKCRPNVTCNSETDDDDIISQASVRAVVSEWPFPGPSGPVQTNANLASNGNFQVHWGQITATGSMDLKREFGAIPWHDAWEMVAFQYGYYDPIWKPGIEARFQVPATPTSIYDSHNWLYQMVGMGIQDPWYEARSRGDYVDDGTEVGVPRYVAYPYDDPNKILWQEQPANARFFRSIFQLQTTNDPPDRKSVLFPRIEYEFWKEIAQSSDDQDGIYYLRPVADGADPLYEDKNGNQGTFLDWVNTATPAPDGNGTELSKAGFYFFDTVNQLNPQDNGPGNLVDLIRIQSPGGTNLMMQGFIYLNAEEMRTTGVGQGGVEGHFNMPGEPYKDVGFWKVDESTGLWEVDGAGLPVLFTEYIGDGDWNFQDLDGDLEFDYFVDSRTVTRPATAGPAPTGTYTGNFIVPYYPGCNPGVDCSEPHEPYLNLDYAALGAIGNIDSNTPQFKMEWAAGTGIRKPKRTNTDEPYGTPVTCTATSTQEDCVSNAYDKDGALLTIPPIMNGVFYNEGNFIAGGNSHWFGSILVQGNIDQANGTADVWFDERLIKGEWPPKEFKFPRVYVSAIKTDR